MILYELVAICNSIFHKTITTGVLLLMLATYIAIIMSCQAIVVVLATKQLAIHLKGTNNC